jgi:ATP-dependent DNA helicase UvrD/PcrA
MPDTLLSGLNPEQLEAVMLPHQPALILAGAGSGKTRVLTTRIAYLIHTGQAAPSAILAVTFTNKAAREMQARINAMLPISTRGMWMGTFHGLCNRFLRIHHREAGLPQLFQILDGQDQLAMIKRLLKMLNIDEDVLAPRELQLFISVNKEAGLRPDAVPVTNEADKYLAKLYAAYDARCDREGVVDFAELLLRSYELLSRDESLREHYRKRFRFILVDEFQDTNRLQYRWLKLLAGPSSPVFAVGDDDQSIYSFRGARVGNMHEFEHDFSGARIIRLEQNYRSHSNILDAANALIRHNVSRLGKNLWTSAQRGEPIRIFRAQSDGEESAFVAAEAGALRANTVRLSEIAVLYRSNAQSRVIEHGLFTAGLPYRVYGGLRFFERQEIKHALAYLRLAANGADDGAFVRVVNFPSRGVGARTLEQLEQAARLANCSLLEACNRTIISGKAGAGLRAFQSIIEELKAGAERLPLPKAVQLACVRSGLRGHYQNERDGKERLANLDELVNAAAQYVEETQDATLAAFLAHASLESGENEPVAGSEGLQLMTVHSAKGLEFHSVFVTGLEERLFPHENSHKEAAALEEERRLLYVALTRARERLYLSFADERLLHGRKLPAECSRFIREIPPELCQWINAPAHPEPAATVLRSRHPGFGPGAPQAQHPSFKVGQNVLHPRFGQGVILKCEGYGGEARVQINFRDQGIKWLDLGFAKLKPLMSS